MPIQECELDLTAGQGDDGVAFTEYITWLEVAHLPSGVAGECLAFN